ncbi:hypothetical protein UFOVP276_211 [uncultured Caudovirales phage]|uniref:Uncharacterized protein n=1 Tax=uncultured Caudovirales phage TaxID=2100421 RepID=A0A6J5LDL6_9CAUD|nr:hypothetical protein UFOVP127_105 [uncultured Caudovirales phage]CAB4135255.1 hypothetical protein UFOVP276_211 [uncultured Caudovirales phage]
MRIKLHSITDLITNSSTVIYTYSDASVAALRKMIDEVFNVLGLSTKCDDVFTLTVTSDDVGVYADAIAEMDDKPDGFDGLDNDQLTEKVEEIFAKVIKGDIEKPQWMSDVEDSEDCDSYRTGTTLNITPKSPAFKKLASLVRDFLYSTEHEANYNG